MSARKTMVTTSSARDPTSERLRPIEVKGRARGAETIAVTRNELLCGLNAQEISTYILALVEVEAGRASNRATCAGHSIANRM